MLTFYVFQMVVCIMKGKPRPVQGLDLTVTPLGGFVGMSHADL